jgi:hypothetical protein
VYGNSACTKVVHPHDTAYNISPQIVEYEDFPYWLAVGIDDRGGLGKETVGLKVILVFGRFDELSVQVQDLLYGSCKGLETANSKNQDLCKEIPIWRSRRDCGMVED